MAEEKLYYTFEQDSRSFIHQINDQLIQLEHNGYNSDVINQIFRCIHSIKSEAAYLQLADIASAAHEMESAIEPLRNRDADFELEKGLLEFCFSIIDKITDGVENIRIPRPQSAEEEALPAEELVPAEEDELQYAVSGYYNDFELLLIREARSRGERLYKLSFKISDDESMKYPRAYLVMSNLEIRYNVINVRPEIDNVDEASQERITVILSSKTGEKPIADEINIDQIENIEISELAYDEQLMNRPVDSDESDERDIQNKKRIISVEASEIDAISEYVSEIKSRLADLSSVVNNDEANSSLGLDLMGLETISSGIEKMMNNLQTVDFNENFAGYRRTVRDLGAKLGKKVELVFDVQNIKVLRDFADIIAEPLLQLIRNAVVHGIEPPDERRTAGKEETGIIRISAVKNDHLLTILVKDDGRGIGIDSVEEGELLELITTAGFSTHDESAEYAGRGVGLDLVKNRIQSRNGKLELVNLRSEGCEFRLVFDETKPDIPFLVVRTDEFTCAVRNSGKESVFSITASEMTEDEGCYYYDEELLFTADGRLKELGEKTSYQALRLSHLGKTGILLFDESLFEVRYSEDSISEGFDIHNYCRELLINGRKAEYAVLTPQVLFD